MRLFAQAPVGADKTADKTIDQASAARSSSRRSLVLLMLFRICRSAAGGMIIVALPYLILVRLGYGSLTLGLIYTTGVASTALMSLGIGHLSDRWSRKGTLLASGAMIPASAAIVWLWHSLPMLFLASIIGGFSATGSLSGGGVGGAAQPVQSAVVADLTEPERRTRYYSVLAFLSGLAGAAGALLVRYISGVDAFLVAAVISAAGLVPLLAMSIPRPKRPPPPPGVSRRTIGQFAATGALNGFSQGLITPFLIPFFVILYHLSRPDMAAYTAAATVLGSFSLLAAPALERRLGFVRSITFTRALGTALLVLMAVWHRLDLGLVIYVLTPALRIAALPAQQTALTSRVDQKELGRALAVNQVTRLSGSSGAILCTGYLFDISALELPFFIFAATMSVNIYLYYRFFGHDGQRGLGQTESERMAIAASGGS